MMELTTEKAQRICLVLAAIACVIAFGAGFVENRLDDERLAWMLSDTRTGPPGMLWPGMPKLWLFGRLVFFAFLYTLIAVGGFLILNFVGRPWPYQLYVPACATGAALAHSTNFYTVDFGVALIFALGPLVCFTWGGGLPLVAGSMGLLVATVPLFLSARTSSREVRLVFLLMFAALWLLGGFVQGFFVAFTGV